MKQLKRDFVARSILGAAALLVLQGLLTGCGELPDETYAGKNTPPLNVINEVQLESRRGGTSDANDNWAEAALFLTDYDRQHNHAVAEVERENYYDEARNELYAPVIAESCGGDDKMCGLVKLDPTMKLESLTLDTANSAIKTQGLKPHSEFKETDFSESSLWLLLDETSYVSGAPKWRSLLAIEIKKIGPNALNVVLRYKVLEYHRI